MRKYLSVFKFNLKSEINFKADYLFSLLSFAVHIFIFNALWEYILADKTLLGYTRANLIWYIIVGEFLAYSIGKKNYIKISDMIKNGDIANLLTKPISLFKYILAQEATSIVTIGVNLVTGIILGLVMAGKLEIGIVQILLFALSLTISLVLSIMISVFIGLLAFITEENKSFHLLISKAMLLLVFTPLEFYPALVQNILKFVPTTYVVYPPAKILVSYDLKTALFLIGGQVLSLIIVFLGDYALNVKGVKNINVNGG